MAMAPAPLILPEKIVRAELVMFSVLLKTPAATPASRVGWLGRWRVLLSRWRTMLWVGPKAMVPPRTLGVLPPAVLLAARPPLASVKVKPPSPRLATLATVPESKSALIVLLAVS